MEKYARAAIAENIKNADDLHVSVDSDIYRVLNLHYNRNNHIEVDVAKFPPLQFFIPPQVRVISENSNSTAPLTLRIFFSGAQQFSARCGADLERIFQGYPKRQGSGSVLEKTHLQSDRSTGRPRSRLLQNAKFSGTAGMTAKQRFLSYTSVFFVFFFLRGRSFSSVLRNGYLIITYCKCPRLYARPYLPHVLFVSGRRR